MLRLGKMDGNGRNAPSSEPAQWTKEELISAIGRLNLGLNMIWAISWMASI